MDRPLAATSGHSIVSHELAWCASLPIMEIKAWDQMIIVIQPSSPHRDGNCGFSDLWQRLLRFYYSGTVNLLSTSMLIRLSLAWEGPSSA